ncbi:MAG: hypothetical protein UZ03_NOB001002386 [Nitrospira sp. OLB3]|nr:MAG: hypothetical protein UZ03_NOB001002386 [Nitrospira sp. OLB3]
MLLAGESEEGLGGSGSRGRMTVWPDSTTTELFQASRYVMERRDGVKHLGGPLSRSGFFVQHAEFIPHQLRIAAAATRVGNESLQQMNRLIRVPLFLQAQSDHQTGIDEEPRILHGECKLFRCFLQEPHVFVGHS